MQREAGGGWVCASERRQADGAAFELLGGFDLGPAQEHKVQSGHAAGDVHGIGSSQRTFHHHRSGGLDKLKLSGHQSHDADGSVDAHCLNVQSVAREEAGLLGDPERQHTSRIGNIGGRHLGELRGCLARERNDVEKRERDEQPVKSFHH